MTATELLERGGGGGVALAPKQHENTAGDHDQLQDGRGDEVLEQPPGGRRRYGETNGGDGDGDDVPRVPLMALNHVSRLCRSVEASVEFYTKVLGFVLIDRPPSLDFNGAWLFNYGVGVHLVQKEDGPGNPHDHDASVDHLDLMDNHISFQCEDMGAVERKLIEMDKKYLRRTINEEEGAPIDQLFFNDPDGFMIEICNCENLELVPAGSAGSIQLPPDRHNPPVQLN